jgi:hypothetical protein
MAVDSVEEDICIVKENGLPSLSNIVVVYVLLQPVETTFECCTGRFKECYFRFRHILANVHRYYVVLRSSAGDMWLK